MAHRPNLSPGPRNSLASRPDGLGLRSEDDDRGARNSESDVAELAAKFAEHSGGSLSPEFSADLALEIVLNEIAEQACLATRATGAAIALRRGSEMVCRASSGSSAPPLGARMDATSGLSGLCIQSGQVQRCDDAQTDPRADLEASERLGVRSVMVLPLSRSLSQPAGVMGIFEVLSTRPSAFSERDERTLEALARRVLRNVERAAEPFLLSREAPLQLRSVEVRSADEPPALSSENAPQLAVPTFAALEAEAGSRRRIDVVTCFLGLIVLAGMVLLALLTSHRLGWNLVTFSTHSGHASSRSVLSQPNASASTNVTPDSGAPDSAVPVSVSDQLSGAKMPGSNIAPTATHVGDLRIYENGREVFRLPADGATPDGPRENDPRREEGQDQRHRIVDVSPAVVIHRVEPEYPEQARSQQLQGKVVLTVGIRPDGTVDGVELTSGEPLLAQAAMDAVKQWRFKPQTGDGQFAEMQTQVTLNFRLPQ